MSIHAIIASLNDSHFATFSVILFVVGFAGMLFNRNLFKKVLSMGFMDSAIFLFLTSTGYVESRIPPIVDDPDIPATLAAYTNPLPAGLVLTGIVVSVSFTAFCLALTVRLYKIYHSLDIDEIMAKARKNED
ncbi:MAG: cation:proton antiporter subunit C [Firmicutes bacterium]|nr:cation:proton antiporter subunit C [Bacillota bacterium]